MIRAKNKMKIQRSTKKKSNVLRATTRCNFSDFASSCAESETEIIDDSDDETRENKHCWQTKINFRITHILDLPEVVLLRLFDYLTFDDLRTLKNVRNKYLSQRVVFKYCMLQRDVAHFIFAGCWTKRLSFPGHFQCKITQNNNKQNARAILHSFNNNRASSYASDAAADVAEPPKKRRRLLSPSSLPSSPQHVQQQRQQQRHAHNMSKSNAFQFSFSFLKVSAKYLVRVMDKSSVGGSGTIIHIMDSKSLSYIGCIEYGEGELNLVEICGDHLLVSSVKQVNDGKLKMFAIAYDALNAAQSSIRLVANLNVSNIILTIQYLAAQQVLMFYTASQHLCFWSVAQAKSKCFCAHHLNLRHNAVVLSADRVWIGSPAELNVLHVRDICQEFDAQLNPNDALRQRMSTSVCMDGEIVASGGAAAAASPMQMHIQSVELTNAARFDFNTKCDIYREWASKRCIQQMVSLSDGVAYFIAEQREVFLVRCIAGAAADVEQLALRGFSECSPLHTEIFQYVEETEYEYPAAVGAMQCCIQVEHQVQKIKVFQHLLMVLDAGNVLWIYTDGAELVKKIDIGDYVEEKAQNEGRLESESDDEEQSESEEDEEEDEIGNCDMDRNEKKALDADFDFDGVQFWITIGSSVVYTIPFQKPSFS